MKITKSQLKQIIKEEIEDFQLDEYTQDAGDISDEEVLKRLRKLLMASGYGYEQSMGSSYPPDNKEIVQIVKDLVEIDKARLAQWD